MRHKYPEGTKLLVLINTQPPHDNPIIKKGNILNLTFSKKYPDSYSLEGDITDVGWMTTYIENKKKFIPVPDSKTLDWKILTGCDNDG